jgi:hypothetical protein
MTQAVCFKCGVIKFGAFVDCPKCGALPESEDDLLLSVAFTDHYFYPATLQKIGRAIEAGESPDIEQSMKDALGPSVREAKVMLGKIRRAK